MSGDTYYFGDSVSMHGGLGNTGIVKNQAAPAQTSPELEAALRQLVELVTELRAQVPPARAQSSTKPCRTSPRPPSSRSTAIAPCWRWRASPPPWERSASPSSRP
ncbi:hypothetical protein ACFQV4_37345 [Streptomyces thermocarboxydus]